MSDAYSGYPITLFQDWDSNAWLHAPPAFEYKLYFAADFSHLQAEPTESDLSSGSSRKNAVSVEKFNTNRKEISIPLLLG